MRGSVMHVMRGVRLFLPPTAGVSLLCIQQYMYLTARFPRSLFVLQSMVIGLIVGGLFWQPGPTVNNTSIFFGAAFLMIM